MLLNFIIYFQKKRRYWCFSAATPITNYVEQYAQVKNTTVPLVCWCRYAKTPTKAKTLTKAKDKKGKKLLFLWYLQDFATIFALMQLIIGIKFGKCGRKLLTNIC